MGDVQIQGRSAEMQPDPSIVRFSSAHYPLKERFAAWCEVYERTLCKQVIEPINPDTLLADVTFRRLPGLTIMQADRFEAFYTRKPSQVEGDNLLFTVGLAGGFEANQLGRKSEIRSGDGFVGTAAEPVVKRLSPGCRSLTLSVPSRAIACMVSGLDEMFGRSIPAGSPALGLLTRYLSFVEAADELAKPELQPTVVKHVYDLLALTLGATRDSAVTAKLGGGRAARLREIKADVERAIGKEEISVGALAARHRLQVRSIQRLFEAEGVTFTEYVICRRLAKAYAMLTDRHFADLPIGAIAFEVGFTDQPYFNRVFRNRYGASPSEVRAGEGRGNVRHRS
jgi:AraC-like DNA-binding protein